MRLILHGLEPIHWAVAGTAIAGVTLALLFFTNRRLGISSSFEDFCSLALPLPYFQRQAVVSGRVWRMPFALGLILGGVLSAVFAGGWSPIWALGLFDERIGLGSAGKLAWMFVGGLFIGFGTRLANGCTSGHGVFGISNLEGASIRSTLAFMAAGVVTTQLIYRVLFA
jgi:uncharacterized membrane protein YedE/YeeE